MAAPIVLTYFNAPGRAFAIRVCLGIANVDYTNAHITFPELVASKADTASFPLGQVPTIKVGDRTFAQSGAIARWAAKKAGMYPRDDDLAALAIDEALDTAQEFSGSVPQLPDAELKKAARAIWLEKKFPVFMGYFGRKVASGPGPFLFGAELSLPDLVLFSSLNGLATGDWDYIPSTCTDAYPWAATLREAVRAHPAVVKFGGLPAPKA
jgi:glutathione S-transferase